MAVHASPGCQRPTTQPRGPSAGAEPGSSRARPRYILLVHLAGIVGALLGYVVLKASQAQRASSAWRCWLLRMFARCRMS
eukprot:12471197-Prorocentrum_lima.AAC.1